MKSRFKVMFRRDSGQEVQVNIDVVPAMSYGVNARRMRFSQKLVDSLKGHEYQRLLEQAAVELFPTLMGS